MGQIGQQLVACFEEVADASEGKSPEYVEPPKDVRDIEELIDSGHNPLHAAYIQIQNVTSAFAEQVSELDELGEYVEIVCNAEDTYRPDGPPWSPLTPSYFTTWAFFDVRFGPDRETIGTCLLDLGDLLGMDELHLEIVRNFQQSRMGIYEHCGRSKSLIRLRELVTGKEYHCHSTSGYRGKKGELWYVRLCPPFAGLADYHITMTTPYLLCNASAEDWTAYLRKNLEDALDTEEALHNFLKYGPTPYHWPEFVFLAYQNFQFDAIFLTGLPDVKSSLPHA